MKCISDFKIMNASVPKIYMAYTLMQQIQHIVEIAPKEAQWFHLVERDKDGDLIVSEMFIPEQTCSSVEVDTDSKMMINFWNELKEKHGIQEASDKFSKMFVWCHSHHNMSVNPSGQDVTQFNQMIETNRSQNNNRPVIMLIFNKREEYYCRAWDPETNFIYEGLDIEYLTANCAWIDEQAKVKFKEPAPVKIPAYFPKTTSTLPGRSTTTKVTSYYPSGTYSPTSGAYSYQNDYSNLWSESLESTAPAADDGRTLQEDYMFEIFGRGYYSTLKVLTENDIEIFAENSNDLVAENLRWFMYCLVKKDKASFSKPRKEITQKVYVAAIKKFFKDKYKPIFSDCEELISYAMELEDAHLQKNQKAFDEIFDDFYLEQKITSERK